MDGGQGSLAVYSPGSHKESDMTEHKHTHGCETGVYLFFFFSKKAKTNKLKNQVVISILHRWHH